VDRYKTYRDKKVVGVFVRFSCRSTEIEEQIRLGVLNLTNIAKATHFIKENRVESRKKEILKQMKICRPENAKRNSAR
jgi:hypothetical protein